jgi:hypothetical protein
MKRFLLALALVAVAAAAYVAAAPGSALHAPPTWKQFTSLKKQVAALQKQVKNVKQEADAGLGVSLLCIMHQPVGVDQVGTSTSGYLFGPPQTGGGPAVTASATSALNLAPSTETSPQHKFYELNTSQSACVQIADQASTLTVARAVAAYAASH